MAVKIISNDKEFSKHIKANKFVLAIFMDDSSVLEVLNLPMTFLKFSLHFPGQPDRLDEDSEEGQFCPSVAVSNT